MFLLKILLRTDQPTKMNESGLGCLFLLSHPDEQTELIFSSQTSQCLLPSQLSDFLGKLPLVDTKLLLFGPD